MSPYSNSGFLTALLTPVLVLVVVWVMAFISASKSSRFKQKFAGLRDPGLWLHPIRLFELLPAQLSVSFVLIVAVIFFGLSIRTFMG